MACVCLRWRPGRRLSEGQGVAVGHTGGADDQASSLGVCLQHLLGLLASHSEETPAAERKGKPYLWYPPGAAWIKDAGVAAGGGGILVELIGKANSHRDIVRAFIPLRGFSGEGTDGGRG